MILTNEHLLQLLLSAFAGALIGFEREFRDKSAGVRTFLLITMGSTLLTVLSLELGERMIPYG